MTFTAEISFTGFGYLRLAARHRQDRHPVQAEILLLRNAPSFEYHWSWLSFSMDDLVRPQARVFLKTRPALDGSMIATQSLYRRAAEIEALGPPPSGGGVADWDGSWARQGLDESLKPLDDIVRLDEDLGIDDVIPPGKDFEEPSPYTGRISLPAGYLSSRRRLLDHAGSPVQFRFGGDGAAPKVLAEQVVWTRPDVESLVVRLDDGQELELDAKNRRGWGEVPVVRLSITNLPDYSVSGSTWLPSDLDMLQLVSASGKVPQVEPMLQAPIALTPHSSCPPPLLEVYPRR